MRSRMFIVTTCVVALVAGFAGTATAHEEGVITLNAKQLRAGDTLRVSGKQLGKGASYRLELRGALQTLNLGRIRADTAGQFTFSSTLPDTLRPGTYAVAAVAADGDVSARADLVVGVGAAGAGGPGQMAGMSMPGTGGMKGMEGMHATAEKMPVKPKSSTVDWTIILIVIAGAALSGALLLRRPGRERGIV